MTTTPSTTIITNLRGVALSTANTLKEARAQEGLTWQGCWPWR